MRTPQDWIADPDHAEDLDARPPVLLDVASHAARELPFVHHENHSIPEMAIATSLAVILVVLAITEIRRYSLRVKAAAPQA